VSFAKQKATSRSTSATGGEDDLSTRPAAVTHRTFHRILIPALALLAAALMNGCTVAAVTMYQLAVDERKIGTYADDKNIEAAIAAKFQ
jgi:hypothetical protein